MNRRAFLLGSAAAVTVPLLPATSLPYGESPGAAVSRVLCATIEVSHDGDTWRRVTIGRALDEFTAFGSIMMRPPNSEAAGDRLSAFAEVPEAQRRSGFLSAIAEDGLT